MRTVGDTTDPQLELLDLLTSPFAEDMQRRQMEEAQGISDYFLPQNPTRQLEEFLQKQRVPLPYPEQRPWLGPMKVGSVFEPQGGMS